MSRVRAPLASQSALLQGQEGASAWSPASGGGSNQAQIDRVRTQAPGAAFDLASTGPRGAMPYKDEMEAAFGVDLSGVQVTRGGPEAQAGLSAMGAGAATDGERFAFMDANPAKKQVAHEVAHLAQGAQGGSLSRASQPGSGAEREADAAASEVARGGTPVITESATPGAVHGDWLGTGLGFLGGGLLGGLLGGPLGAVAGAVGGAYGGDKATSESRELTPEEKAYAARTFGKSVDLDKVRIATDSAISAGGSHRTVGNTIYVTDGGYTFDGEDTSAEGDTNTILTHEMAHVLQYQTEGPGYMFDSLASQAWAKLAGGDAYDWRKAVKAGAPWELWNPEQQADALQAYNLARMRVANLESQLSPESWFAESPAQELSDADQKSLAFNRDILATLQPHVDAVRAIGEPRASVKQSPAPTQPGPTPASQSAGPMCKLGPEPEGAPWSVEDLFGATAPSASAGPVSPVQGPT